jgi:hypothetical protein
VMARLPKLLSNDGFVASRIRSPELLELHRPESAQHFVQFYEDDSFVIGNIAYLAAKALEAGDSSVIVATDPHLNAIAERLLSFGLDLEGPRESGRYAAVDAGQALSRILVNGRPDRESFDDVIGGMVHASLRCGANDFTFVFGEMVALLCAAGDPGSAVLLERLWNSLAQRCRFSLCCAYPIASLGANPDMNVLTQICAEHALTIPAEAPL